MDKKLTWLDVWDGFDIQEDPKDILVKLKESKKELEGKPAQQRCQYEYIKAK